jgi:hypothetical protein
MVKLSLPGDIYGYADGTRWETKDPLAGIRMHGELLYALTRFRFRNDDGNLTTATWRAAENTNTVNIAPGVTFRVRFQVHQYGTNLTETIAQHNLICDRNLSGFFIAAGAGGGAVLRLRNSAFVADQALITSPLLTQPGTAAYVNGRFVGAGGLNVSPVSYDSNTYAELEYAIDLEPAIAWNTNDIVRMRPTLNGNAFNQNSLPDPQGARATATVNVPPTGTPAPTVTQELEEQITLSWPTVTSAASYDIRINGGTVFNFVSAASPVVFRHGTDAGTVVPGGTTYAYEVRARNEFGTGPYSTAVQGTSATPPINQVQNFALSEANGKVTINFDSSAGSDPAADALIERVRWIGRPL